METNLIMYKISGGIKSITFELKAMSDNHAVTVANDLYNRLGLIGRYYCETSNGYCFMIQ